MVSLRFFFKKTSVQKHYTEIVKNGIAFMLSLTRTHSLCETEGIEFNAVIIPTDVDRSLKFLQIKQKAAGNPAAFRCFWVYKVDRFHSESVNLSWLRGQDLNLRPPGYEPDELPSALPRVMWLVPFGVVNRFGEIFFGCGGEGLRRGVPRPPCKQSAAGQVRRGSCGTAGSPRWGRRTQGQARRGAGQRDSSIWRARAAAPTVPAR